MTDPTEPAEPLTLTEQIRAVQADTEFMDRARAAIEANRAILDRLAET